MTPLLHLVSVGLGVTYSVGLGALVLYGARVLWLTVVYSVVRGRQDEPQGMSATPSVTVQLPLYNEQFVAGRAIDAACRLRWPGDRLEIQVLDDSTDETRAIVDARVHGWRCRGVDVRVIRRQDRQGFKAGALAHGTAMARGEILAILDADFVPRPDFLEQTVPHMCDGVAAVQTRWGHLNAEASGLTRAQALALDGYFLIEQTARSRSGMFLVFNGSGGLWRRSAIEQAGGWQGDTLSEDVDLSYRAQLAGWRVVFLPDVVAPAELPEDLGAYRRQQHRWACGTTQVLRKLGPRVARCQRSRWIRTHALMSLAAHFVHPVSLTLFLLAPAVMVIRPELHIVVGLVAVAALSPPLMYLVAAVELGGDWPRRLAAYPLLAAVSAGMTLLGTRAVIDAITGRPTAFERTPKSGGGGRDRTARHGADLARPQVAEMALAAYGWVGLLEAIRRGSLGFAVFFALFAAGFTLTVALLARGPSGSILRPWRERPREDTR